MKKDILRKVWLFMVTASLLLSACSGRASAESIGDPQAGKSLFEQTAIREAPACSTCHSVTPGERRIGPSLAGIAGRAGEGVSGLTASDYLLQSILDPNAYVVEGFAPGVMYPDFARVLTEDEVKNLIAYLLTLK